MCLEQALLLAGLLLTAEPGRKMTDHDDDFGRRIETFLDRIGFSKLEQLTGTDGVRAGWDDLRAILSAQLRQLRPRHFDTHIVESSLVEADWNWQRGDNYLSVSIFVSGAGFVRIHRRLRALSTETSMVRIPYGPGPSGLGDLSMRHQVPGSDVIMWAYRNVCVSLGGDGPEVDLEPVARTIQRFLEIHRVPRVAEYLPRVDRIDSSAKTVHVGEEWRVGFQLVKEVATDSVTAEILEVVDGAGHRHLERIHASDRQATYRAASPGVAQVEIHVVDRKTLLSPPLAVSVEVLPAR
jgi:hypothetical protein